MGYKVDLAELQAVITSLEQFGRVLDAKLADLDKASDDLHITWLGEAATAHRTAHAKLVHGAQEVRAGLATMHLAARRAHTNYTNAVDANTQTWRQLR